MSLMKQTTSYAELEKKYHGFVVPTIKMKIDGSEVPDDLIKSITQLSLDMTCLTDQMNVLNFTVAGLYDYKAQSFDDEVITKYFKLGNNIEVELGYITTTPLFKGYIYEVNYSMDISEGISLNITCKDFKGLLSNKKGDSKRGSSNRMGEVRKILLNAAYNKYASLPGWQFVYLEGLELAYSLLELLGVVQDEHDPISTELEKVQSVANSYLYEFFVVYDEIYFRPKFFIGQSNIMTISPMEGLLNINMNYNIGKVIGTVEVRGQNPEEMNAVTGKATKPIPKNVTSNTVAVGYETIYSDQITSTAQAQSKAMNLLKYNAWESTGVQVTTIGIPDIIPGRNIKIDGISKSLNKEIYILQVRHQINRDQGYITTFSGGINIYG